MIKLIQGLKDILYVKGIMLAFLILLIVYPLETLVASEKGKSHDPEYANLPDYKLDITEGDLYFNTGHYYQALKFYKLALESDSVRLDDHRTMEQIHRMISCYDCLHNESKKAQYVDLLLQKQEADAHTRNICLWTIGCITLLLGILLWLTVRYNLIIRLKNTAMVQTIENLLVYKTELENLRKELHQNEATTGNVSVPEAIPEVTEEPIIPVPAEEVLLEKEVIENQRLYWELDAIVTEQKLFLKDIKRDDLIKLIGVNKNRFAKILQQNVNMPLPSYLNKKRMEYAASLLQTCPEYTIATIAKLCGISLSNFNKMFKSKYGMAPAEFRDKPK